MLLGWISHRIAVEESEIFAVKAELDSIAAKISRLLTALKRLGKAHTGETAGQGKAGGGGADAGLAGGAAGEPPVLVTYNGRAFDAPVLDGRATMHRRRAGFDALRHVDMLMPARRLYRGWLPSCRLADVEAQVLGLTRPAGEVEGAETPVTRRWIEAETPSP